MSWESRTLGEVVDLTQGFCINKKSNHLVVDEGIPLLRITDMINSQQKIFISPEIPEKFIANKDDIIFTRTGQVGLVFRNQYGIIHNNCFTVSPLNDELSKDYLYWFLRSDETITKAKGLAAGAAQPDLNHGAFKSISITYPKSLQTQKRIANILSVYDDLIENNLKRIKLLGQAAQNIYKEWFVQMRFPGHENTPVIEETGLPEGWEKINLYDFAEIQMGYAFKAKDFNNEITGNPAIRIRDILSGWTKTYTTEIVSDKYKVKNGDILVGMDGIFHLGMWSGQENALLVQRVCRLRAKNKILQGYLIEAIREPIKYYEQTISGATVAHLGAKHLKEIFVLIPDDKSLNRLSIFYTIHKDIIALNKQNQKLKAARDILLPRLMNRTIEV